LKRPDTRTSRVGPLHFRRWPTRQTAENNNHNGRVGSDGDKHAAGGCAGHCRKQANGERVLPLFLAGRSIYSMYSFCSMSAGHRHSVLSRPDFLRLSRVKLVECNSERAALQLLAADFSDLSSLLRSFLIPLFWKSARSEVEMGVLSRFKIRTKLASMVARSNATLSLVGKFQAKRSMRDQRAM
jgi:hypothetical protein